jgi:hypothetical protein
MADRAGNGHGGPARWSPQPGVAAAEQDSEPARAKVSGGVDRLQVQAHCRAMAPALQEAPDRLGSATTDSDTPSHSLSPPQAS